MSEYWKSTPTYWCKFCSTYVRDTSIARKNHEASGKHQGSVQRNLRELQKTKSREERDVQRAKDEVARLDGIVSGGGGGRKKGGAGGVHVEGLRVVNGRGGEVPKLNAAAQRKAHAEQLAAMGVQLPGELRREVTGVGGWESVSERVVPGNNDNENGNGWSLADIVKREGESERKEDVKDVYGLGRGVHKRKAGQDEDEEREQEQEVMRKAWGSKLRSYPGGKDEGGEDGDLEVLLNGVGAKKIKREEVKEEGAVEGEKKDLAAIPVKQEGGDEGGAPVVFKKRKGKR